MTQKKLSLVECTAEPPEGVYWVNLPLHTINVLAQMRSTISADSIDDLSASIKKTGQMNLAIVIALTESESRRYLKQINAMWGTEYKISSFSTVYLDELGCDHYLFIVAGHRRLKAVQMNKGTYFGCQLWVGISFSKALRLQFQENLHQQVTLDDEARFLALLWRQEKKSRPSLTLATFSRSLGKKPDQVRRSIRFTSLPVEIQNLVLPSSQFKKGIGFALLCELARLQEARVAQGIGYNETELMSLAYTMVVNYRTAKAAAGWVTEQIKEINGQNNMFELTIEDAVGTARRSVESGLEWTIKQGCSHLEAVAHFHTNDKIQRITSQTAVTAVGRVIDLVGQTAPQIIAGIQGGRGATSVAKRIKEIIS